MFSVKENIGMDLLRTVKVIRPDGAGEYWEGIPHHQLLAALLQQLREKELTPSDPTIGLSADNADLIATLTVEGNRLPLLVERLHHGLGLITSNARRHALRIYYGVWTEEGIGIPIGTLQIGGKHTNGFDLQETVNEIVRNYLRSSKIVGKEVARLMSSPITYSESCSLLVEAGKQGLMPWSRIGRVESIYQAMNRTSTWELLVAFAHVVGMNPPFDQMKQTDAFRQILPVKGKIL